MDANEQRRIARQLNLPGWSLDVQQELADAHVLVIGAGGLGCPAMQGLAAAGIGHITLIDDDTVDITNIQRQILFGASDVGRPKVEVAAGRLRELQPSIIVTTVQERLTTANALDLVAGADIVLDGSDTFATKYLVADACEITATPLVWATVLRFSGQVALWHSGPGLDTPSLRDLFPEQPSGDSVPDCATAGVLGVTTAVIGNLMATDAIKYLTGLGVSQPGRVLSYDALAGSTRALTVARDPSRPLVTQLSTYEEACGTSANEGLLDEVSSGAAVALDIREPHEYLLGDIPAGGDLRKLPLSAIDSPRDVAEALEGAHRVVVYCASGVRSAAFAEKYSDLGFDLVSLPGGVNGV